MLVHHRTPGFPERVRPALVSIVGGLVLLRATLKNLCRSRATGFGGPGGRLRGTGGAKGARASIYGPAAGAGSEFRPEDGASGTMRAAG